jgi:ABC-type sugar transport system ATPase subunit
MSASATSVSRAPRGRAVANPLLETRGVTKRFPGVVALQDVNLDLRRGEIHALAGENGSGKSTLMKIIAGVLRPDVGSVTVDGTNLLHGSVANALKHGVTLITQELALVPDLTVAENIFLGHRQRRRRGYINWRGTRAAASDILGRLDVDLDPGHRVGMLPVDQQQIVEIARALSFDTRVLLMDEPTSSLDPTEVDLLFRVMRQLRDEGAAIMFVSHRLREMLDVADRVTVLRDGVVVADACRADLDEDWLVTSMVGRELKAFFPPRPERHTSPVLEVDGLQDRAGRVRDASFKLLGGQITGLAGLVGAGRTELVETIVGFRPQAAGHVRVGDVEVPAHPAAAIAAGIALVSDDRTRKAAVATMSVRDNILLAERRAALALRHRRSERAAAQGWCDRLEIRCPDVERPLTALSGGNQQKVMLARCLSREPKVLLLDEPTRGIDVGAKAEIYRLIVEFAERGVAVLLVSSELTEILALCERVLVMQHGRLVADLRDDLSERRIVAAATGVPI